MEVVLTELDPYILAVGIIAVLLLVGVLIGVGKMISTNKKILSNQNKQNNLLLTMSNVMGSAPVGPGRHEPRVSEESAEQDVQ